MKYIKKPVIVDAIQFKYSKEGLEELKSFLGDSLGDISAPTRIFNVAEAEIKTLEDGKNLKVKHIAQEGDYIIKGVEGEFYACKPDIFKKTYSVYQGDKI